MGFRQTVWAIVVTGMGGAGVGWAQVPMPDLVAQPSPQAVLDEHFDALNKCDVKRIVAQYPDDAQINLPGGTIIKGRPAILDLFIGFCKSPAAGGLNGLTFKVEHSVAIDGTFATQWVATAPFLTEPYRGSDAYITRQGFMQAMVSTFDGAALKRR